MPKLLGEAEISTRLRKTKGWKRDKDSITKNFEFDDFMEGIRFVKKVAKVAERQEHHPDIAIRYTTVVLSLQTHSEGGVTKWDLELAEAIDRIRPKKG